MSFVAYLRIDLYYRLDSINSFIFMSLAKSGALVKSFFAALMPSKCEVTKKS